MVLVGRRGNIRVVYREKKIIRLISFIYNMHIFLDTFIKPHNMYYPIFLSSLYIIIYI